MLTDNCIYTIRRSRDLEECLANGRRGGFEEQREWKAGKQLLDEARRSGKRLPIIFAPAEDTRRLFAWALIDEIASGPTTSYSFSELQLLADRPIKSVLKKARDGTQLNEWFIRPYAICQTPSFLANVGEAASPRATRFWACHWQNRLWRDDINAEYEPVCSTGSNMFRKRGVSVGDVAYVISIADGYLLLGGRMKIKRIVSRREAMRIRRTTRLYDAVEWIIDEDEDGTPLNLHRRLDPALSRRLRFLSRGKDEKVLFFTSETRLDGQATRGVRELSPSSAALLDRIIATTDDLPPSKEMFTVTADMLHEGSDESFQLLPADLEQLREGGVQRSLATRHERNRRARDLCIAHYGLACRACGFEFRTVYGDEMADFIHVHHINPVADAREEHSVDPIKDLIPLCPNCHAVAHSKDPPCPVDYVKQLLRRQRVASEKVMSAEQESSGGMDV